MVCKTLQCDHCLVCADGGDGDIDDVDDGKMRNENWCCQLGHVCGLQTGLLQCDRCLVRDDGDDDDNGRT